MGHGGGRLVREAGGLIGDLDGNEGYLDSGRVVATNPKLFNSFLQLLKQRS